ncbi:MAG TPA: hypothetical protein VGR28_01985 [Candidatus Thermoplasmatota archaeon]|jgi:hypothetical protein|nr:hypothetical protein [Candidatus Thermoplasmatota archaeon]
MAPIRVSPARAAELRAAVKAFAEAPGPARFHRVVRLLEGVPDAPRRGARRGRLP